MISATQLRQNIYQVLDEVLKTGVPIEIKRRGKVLKIMPKKKVSKLGCLKKHDCINGDPESLVHLDWSKEWKGEI